MQIGSLEKCYVRSAVPAADRSRITGALNLVLSANFRRSTKLVRRRTTAVHLYRYLRDVLNLVHLQLQYELYAWAEEKQLSSNLLF